MKWREAELICRVAVAVVAILIILDWIKYHLKKEVRDATDL